jgi:choline/glycine/proline betaine transport protein
MTEQQSEKKTTINKPVFFIATGIILVFLFAASVFSRESSIILEMLQETIIEKFGWFYLLSVAIFLIFTVGVAFSNYGTIKLGPDHSEAEFSYPSWFAMLFSAGMGIGLVFFAVAEPIQHYIFPPVGQPNTIASAQQAMSITFFHWGVHAWAIYAVIGLSLAYFGYRHSLPMSLRSALFPLIGNRIHGPLGNAIDIFAIIGTMVGIATSLGFGAIQVTGGLDFLFGTGTSNKVVLLTISIVTLFAIGSVILGLDNGLKRLSVFNLLLALVIMCYVFINGPTLKLFPYFVENIGNYLSGIVKETFTLYAYRSSGQLPEWAADWTANWTLFYWAWWIAWSPFVGMFIARISRGRTIREFLVGVLVVPALLTFAWMTIFGNTAINFQSLGIGNLAEVVVDDMPLAFFEFFALLPWGNVFSFLAIILVAIFFVTSMDSGALVVDMISTGGEASTTAWRRIFWALGMGAIAGVLLVMGGLDALQTAVVVSAFPFVFVMLLVCLGLLRGLRIEALRLKVNLAPSQVTVARTRASWEKRLRAIINHPKRDEVQKFMKDNIVPAFMQVSAEFEKQNIHVALQQTDDVMGLEVSHGEEINFVYKVHLKSYATPSFILLGFSDDESKQKKYFRAEVHLLEGNQYYDVMGYTVEEMIEDVLSQYDKHMQFLHLADQ